MDDPISSESVCFTAIRTAITHTRIIDGAGSPAFPGDIVLQDGIIAAVLPFGAYNDDGATVVIDGTNLVTCPGFIDMFGTSGTAASGGESGQSALARGVTTEVLGLEASVSAPLGNGSGGPLESVQGTNIAFMDSRETEGVQAAGSEAENPTDSQHGTATNSAASPSHLESPGMLASLLPSWARSGETDEILAELREEETVSRIRADIEASENPDWDEIVISMVESGQLDVLVGQSIKQIAAIQSSDPISTFLRILRADSLSTEMLQGSCTDEDLRSIGCNPAQANIAEPVDLTSAIHQMTGLPASILGLANRGVLATGHAADVLVFDPDAIIDVAAFADPRQPGAGTTYVFVNGVPAVFDHRPMSASAGRSLRRGAEGTT
ncbi:amidohydrolase family protein [Paeniglutamicibacter antarcticus]|uniref:Amidohydrolase family protein n=1 Tax=Paeniglutamicibacter antarcticus TaxID=494023 RepID=A0ABP9TLF0_9MICC